jgi:nucleotide-binding universal stress UspA family protein
MSASTVSPRGNHRLAVRPIGRGELQRIVVGLDDTPTSRAALRWAARQARLTGATVRAVHVIDWPIGIEALGSAETDDDGRLPEEKVSAPYRRGIRRVFDEACPEPGWQLQFAEGDAGSMLVAEAADADLLVIGTRANPDWSGDVAGPVAHHCLGRAACPVDTVPPEDSESSAPHWLGTRARATGSTKAAKLVMAHALTAVVTIPKGSAVCSPAMPTRGAAIAPKRN